MTTAPSTPDAAQITKAAGSNLAMTFLALEPEVRRDLEVFYAYCRLVDDLADDDGLTLDYRRDGLLLWRRAIVEPVENEPPLAATVRDLIARHSLNVADLHEIIAGCEMDLTKLRYETWEELRLYCHRVASVVGVVSAKLFRAKSDQAVEYSLNLGLSLQLTNILRDVGEDLERGRIYLPQEDMARFGVTDEQILARRHNDAFVALMEFESERCAAFYRRTAELLHPDDRRAFAATELMVAIYSRVLARMRRDRFQVFTTRYRVPTWQKLGLIGTAVVRRWLNV